jgi:DNA-binding MarR family transcriptional regulator
MASAADHLLMSVDGMTDTQDILRNLRRIVKRVEAASAELEAAHGITAPQLLCLHALVMRGSLTQIELSREVRLSASTLVGVIDRLEAKGLVVRKRDPDDRRRIHVTPTAAGLEAHAQAPTPLHIQVERGLAQLAPDDRTRISEGLARIVHLLEADRIDAAPVLTSGPIPKPAELEAQRSPEHAS